MHGPVSSSTSADAHRLQRPPTCCHTTRRCSNGTSRSRSTFPLYGADPDHAWLGTKSGGRALFARAGVPHPLGAEHIRSIADATDAICALRAAKPELAEVIIKLDNAVSGEGNALLDLAAMPAPGTPAERELIHQRLVDSRLEVDGVTPAAFLAQARCTGWRRGRADHRPRAAQPERPATDHADTSRRAPFDP